MNDYVVATIKSWNVEAFNRNARDLPGNWHLLTDREALSLERLRELKPRYVFFPHWSWVVPREITQEFECVCFHMTDVPYGRGGSPLQNLIARGHRETRLTALRMVPELDAGPVYFKKTLSLDGTAQEIFQRAAERIYSMIRTIVVKEPVPEPQSGIPVYFERRTPAESRMPTEFDPAKLYDFIRMLDAESYPKAFIEYGSLRIEFNQAQMGKDWVECRAIIMKNSSEKK